MDFEYEKFNSGLVNPHRWVSSCGMYAIAKYSVYRHQRVKPYWVGYRRSDGKRITNAAKLTFDQAQQQVEEFEKRSKNYDI